MAILKLRAGEIHAVLGRLLDQVRMADIPVAELTVRLEQSGYVLRLSLETQDRNAVHRLLRRAGGIVGVSELELIEERLPLSPVPAALGFIEAA